jgi:hypothetical protein
MIAEKKFPVVINGTVVEVPMDGKDIPIVIEGAVHMIPVEKEVGCLGVSLIFGAFAAFVVFLFWKFCF